MATFVKTITLTATNTAYQALDVNLNHSITFISSTANNVVLDVKDSPDAMTAVNGTGYLLVPANMPVRIQCANPSRVWINPSVAGNKMSMIFGD